MRTGFVAVAALFVVACEASGGGERTLTAFAASSLTEVFATVELEFEADHPDVDVVVNLAGSSTLATQLLAGAEADVFASADTIQMDRVTEELVPIVGPQVMATNSLVLVVEEGNPAQIGGVEDLARDDLVVVLGAPEVPVGRYASELLEEAGVEAVEASYEANVRTVLSKVELGEADAGIVYRSDVGSADVDAIEIARQLNVTATYPIAAFDAGEPDLAASFVDFVMSAEGESILAEAGFTR